MRHYFSKRCVTWGAALLLAAMWQAAHAQAPRQGERQAGQFNVAAPYVPAGGPMPTPQNYFPPSAPQGPFDLSSIPQPAYVPMMAAAGNPPAAAPNNPPPAQPQSSAKKSPFSLPSFLKRPQQAAAAKSAPSPRPAPQKASPIITGPTVPPPGAVQAQPPIAAPARLIGGQAPAALPRGPVVIYMPPGWQPPGATINFTQREISPEVPDDHWPMATRNPLGDPNAGGMFRWPKAARGEAEETRAVPRVPAKAILPAGTVADESRRKPEDDEDVPTWKTLLTTTSGPRPPNQKAKALFGLNPKQPRTSAPVGMTAASAAPASAAPAASAVAPQAAPAASPRAVAAAMTRGPTPAVAATPTVVDSRNQPVALAEAAPQDDDNSNSNLKWRAKGSPRRSIDADGSPADAGGRAQVAAHTQAAGPTLAIPQPPLPVESTQAAPGGAVPTPAAASVPTQAAPPAAAGNNSKALIPGSLLHPSPAVAVLEPVQGQGFELTAARQSGTKALVNLAAPESRKRAPTPAAVAATSGPQPVQTKALFPTMFVKNSPREVSLTTKPRAPESPMMYEGPSEPFDEYDDGESLDSYYAPTLESESAQRQRGKRSKSAQHRHERTQADAARSKHPDHEARTHAPPREIPPLAKPFVALSEMTKLPRFITGLTREDSQLPRPPRFEEAYPSDLARRGPSHKVKIKQRIPQEELDDEAEADEAEVAPDVSAERPSKRRSRSNVAESDETPDRRAPLKRRELAANGKAKRDPHEELHELYLSATAGRTTPNHGEEIRLGPDREEADDEVEGEQSDNVEATGRQRPRRENVPVVALEEEKRAEPKSANSAKGSNSRPVRIRKSDGTSVLVYTKRATVSAPQESVEVQAASTQPTPKSPAGSSARRRLARESGGDANTLRKNPLR